MAGRLFQRDAKQGHVHGARIEEVRQSLEVRWRPRRFADPEKVGVHDQNRVAAEQLQAFGKTTAGVHQASGLVGYHDLQSLTSLEISSHLIRMMMNIDCDPVDPCGDQKVEHIVEHRLATNLHQRLRGVVGNRAHAGSKPRCEHHGLFNGHLIRYL